MTNTRKTKAVPTSPLRCAIYTRKSTEAVPFLGENADEYRPSSG